MFEIFMYSPKALDRYCLLGKFEAINLYNFGNWDELQILSLKMKPVSARPLDEKVEGERGAEPEELGRETNTEL